MPARVRRARTEDLTTSEIAAIRELLVAAFGTDEDEAFTDDDWEHAVGGLHFVCELDGGIVAHASVVEREIHVDDRALRTGYVEAVATAPGRQGAGFGSLVMARGERLHPRRVRAGWARHRAAGVLRAARLADLDRAVGRAHRPMACAQRPMTTATSWC